MRAPPATWRHTTSRPTPPPGLAATWSSTTSATSSLAPRCATSSTRARKRSRGATRSGDGSRRSGAKTTPSHPHDHTRRTCGYRTQRSMIQDPRRSRLAFLAPTATTRVAEQAQHAFGDGFHVVRHRRSERYVRPREKIDDGPDTGVQHGGADTKGREDLGRHSEVITLPGHDADDGGRGAPHPGGALLRAHLAEHAHGAGGQPVGDSADLRQRA